MFPFFYILERISRQMPLEGKVNPRLKGALTRDEFIEQYARYLTLFYINSWVDASKNWHYDFLYNEYLEAYKYDEDEYNKIILE